VAAIAEHDPEPYMRRLNDPARARSF